MLFSLLSKAQFERVYKFDDYIQVNFSPEIDTLDTLGLHMVYSIIDGGFVSVSVSNHSESENGLVSKDALKEYYNGFIKGYVKGAKVKLNSKRFIRVDSLYSVKFSYESSTLNGKRFGNVVVLYIKDKTYSFECQMEDEAKESLDEVSKEFYSLAKVKDSFNPYSQFDYSHKAQNDGYKIGYFIGKYLIPLLIMITLVIVIIIVIVKRRT